MNEYEKVRDAINKAKSYYDSVLKSDKPYSEFAKPIYDDLCDAEIDIAIIEKYCNKLREFIGDDIEWI